MIEVIKHTLGICGEHWHPNIFTALASTPIIVTAVNYVKCKVCGMKNGLHKLTCPEQPNPQPRIPVDIKKNK